MLEFILLCAVYPADIIGHLRYAVPFHLQVLQANQLRNFIVLNCFKYRVVYGIRAGCGRFQVVMSILAAQIIPLVFGLVPGKTGNINVISDFGSSTPLLL